MAPLLLLPSAAAAAAAVAASSSNPSARREDEGSGLLLMESAEVLVSVAMSRCSSSRATAVCPWPAASRKGV